MPKVRVHGYSVSLDGFGAGPNQDLQHPLGVGGERLHNWVFGTRTFRKVVLGQDGGETGVDDAFVERGFHNVGAWILGRNMFGPVRGPWPDDEWKGWWGDSPPYHTEVFVLTHHPRASFQMEGNTTFHFVTDGIAAALDRAKAAAGDRDVRVGGGAATIRQYLSAKLIDELHLAMAPTLLGTGEPLFTGINLPALGYTVTECVPTPAAVHYVLTRGGEGKSGDAE